MLGTGLAIEDFIAKYQSQEVSIARQQLHNTTLEPSNKVDRALGYLVKHLGSVWILVQVLVTQFWYTLTAGSFLYYNEFHLFELFELNI